MKLSAVVLLAGCALLTACKPTYNPKTVFEPFATPPPPDYSKSDNWAALPQRFDMADFTPAAALKDQQENAAVDVFFLHPTLLTKSVKHGDYWNGDVSNAKLNKLTDNVSIKLQATAFNGAGKIYAPRYRQGHYYCFVTKDTASAAKALDTAYTDVRNAFRYYIDHYNNGRPFMIAGHSQGSRHAMQLIKEEIENTPLEAQLVVAYIAGWPVPYKYFKKIKPCESPDETDCFCSWRTFERKFGLKNANQKNIACTNPIIWKSGEHNYAPKSLHRGAVLRDFKKVRPQLCDAETYNGFLLCSRPRFPGSFLIRSKNYHAGDINLYYLDIRENAMLRAAAFPKK